MIKLFTIIDCLYYSRMNVSFEHSQRMFKWTFNVHHWSITVSPFSKFDDVTSLDEATHFIPNRYTDAARLVSHFTCAHLMTVFGLRHSSLNERVWEKIQILIQSPDDYCWDSTVTEFIAKYSKCLLHYFRVMFSPPV